MQGSHPKSFQWLKVGTYIGFLVFLILPSFLSGCATDVKSKPAPVVEQDSMPKGLAVKRLEDGRQGFMIMETPQMDNGSRRDFDRAVVLLNEGEYNQAIELLEKIIEQSPGVTAPYINMAIAYRRLGKLEQAEEHLKTALVLFPEHPVACNEYGLLYRQTGRFSEARAIYEKVLARFPEYYPVHRNLGILCDLYLNDPACALEHYEIYSRAMPGDQRVTLWIADLRARLGRN